MRWMPILLTSGFFSASFSLAADRYEAESAMVDENSVQKVADAGASGGFYVGMKEGSLSFRINATTAGFFTLWVAYSQPNDPNGKIQNLAVNGSSVGQISFPQVSAFTSIKAASKIKLAAGANTLEITKSWGWVNIDYIELTPYAATPFAVVGSLVSPNPSPNAVKLHGFLRENFLKKVISGAMSNRVMQDDGKYTPMTVDNQVEMAWVIAASGKTPALLGLDLFHATGLKSDAEWHQGYTKATLALAEDIYKRGGIPAFCWHWMDPSMATEAFYSASSGNTPYTSFNLKKAYKDTAALTEFDTTSAEYKAMIRDLDIIAGHLKVLADKGVPVLWRPLHEASGKWFWWGYSGAKACMPLYRLMFDRFTGKHGLNNLIWVWTSDEAGDAMDWYPGDAYVDIVSRDFYYYPRIANHGSLVASFEKLKDIFGGDKIIALSENGSIPHPDSLVSDGAGWSYFMPWYGDYTMDGWAHDNTAADWKSILNHDYVITLDEMPGWDNYVPTANRRAMPGETGQNLSVWLSARGGAAYLELNVRGTKARRIDIYNPQGHRMATLHSGSDLSEGRHRFPLPSLPAGMYGVKVGGMPGLKSLVIPP